MKLEDRYIVLKKTDLFNMKSSAIIDAATEVQSKMNSYRHYEDKPSLECLVIEKDWPEYKPALAMLSERVDREAGVTKSDIARPMAFGVELISFEPGPHFDGIEKIVAFVKALSSNSVQYVRLRASDIELLRLHGYVKETLKIKSFKSMHNTDTGYYFLINEREIFPSVNCAITGDCQKIIAGIEELPYNSFRALLHPEDIKLILKGTKFEHMVEPSWLDWEHSGEEIQNIINCVEVCHGVQEGTYLKIDGKKVVPSKHAARWASKKKLMSLIANCSDISYIVMQPEDIKLVLKGTGFEGMYSEEVLNGKPAPVQEVKLKHSHYHKNVANLEMIDIYRIIDLYGITDPCIQHAIKKLLVAGGRGGGKDIQKDIQESIDTLVRWQDMRLEDLRVGSTEAPKWGEE